jgi:hypothetical protein
LYAQQLFIIILDYAIILGTISVKNMLSLKETLMFFVQKKILMKFDFVDSLINESVQIISVRLKYLFWLLIATFFSLAILITVAALTKTT